MCERSNQKYTDETNYEYQDCFKHWRGRKQVNIYKLKNEVSFYKLIDHSVFDRQQTILQRSRAADHLMAQHSAIKMLASRVKLSQLFLISQVKWMT